MKNSPLANGALSAAISGAGPTIFSLFKEQNTADKVAVSRSDSYLNTRIYFGIPISKINNQGVKIL